MSFHELTGDYPWLTKRMASALAFVQKREIRHPRRNFFAGVLSIFVPRLGAGGGLSLLVTIAMLAVLAAIAIPAYQDYVVRAQVARALADAAAIRLAVEVFRGENDEWPASLLDIGYQAESIPTTDGSYTMGVYDEGVIAISLGVDTLGQSQYLVLEPYIEADGVKWECYGQNAVVAQLPSACR
jgi:hypothetical protein